MFLSDVFALHGLQRSNERKKKKMSGKLYHYILLNDTFQTYGVSDFLLEVMLPSIHDRFGAVVCYLCHLYNYSKQKFRVQ